MVKHCLHAGSKCATLPGRLVENLGCLYPIEVVQVRCILRGTVQSLPPTSRATMILHILIAMVAGWLQRHQQQVITYLLAENHMLKAQLGGRRLRLTDTERHRLAALAHPLGRKRLKEIATLVTPDTLLRW